MLDDKPCFIFRFVTQERATNYLNKIVKQFEDHIIYTDMLDKSVEFDDAIYYFWDMLRDDGFPVEAEYDEQQFHKVVSELMYKYSV